MKKRVQNRKADYLLDELGQVDDEFLTEAMNWHGSARKAPRKNSVRVLLAAASLALMFAVGTVGMVTMFRRSGHAGVNEGVDRYSSADGSEQTRLGEMDRMLRDCVAGDSFERCTNENLNFFDGTMRLVVEERATGEVFVSHPLSISEQSAVIAEFRAAGTPLSEDGAESAYLVWVTLGNGSVVTPCLSPSAGNIGAAVLFDYSSERAPTQIFTDLLSGMR